ncbi:UDP-N-acetylglucosamine_transferase subunit ALG14 [Hexamita inflata]|uniref:UDP-N-acetylglucosamine transferase subunit ALG14 n=1 Tax=Hexamita inflata TaxID=28002 RepID=A0AA86UI35_9EUKA|nr:UDP-N-acetylglucosamine transferase subunit ALG14 [Hexamita inflata]
MLHQCFNIVLGLLLIIQIFLLIRLCARPQKSKTELFILGSGGHTREMLHILSLVKPTDPIFVHADSDILSKDLTSKIYQESKFIPIVRARQVKQSYFTSIFSTVHALFKSFKIIYDTKPSLLISNGPGTALPLMLSAWILTKLNFINCKTVFVESYCRIQHLSLTGKLCKFFVNEFVVNWEGIHKKGMKYIELYPK